MYDMLPFPNITATDVKEQATQINNYLMQLKEALEFILTNITADNLSSDLINKLNSLGASIEKSKEEREEQLQQVSNKTITVSDVINSSLYKSSIQEVEKKIPTKYLLSAEQTKKSETAGKNVLSIKDESGEITEFTVDIPSVVIRVNYETGELEYEQLQVEGGEVANEA